ncbi:MULTISPECIES: helix-turn-helix domain-containing protein [Vagococcus]|uniref:helix-turn-helix domain-containing protein n=1 Tax=Vagococcus TaxID=2737 RepID=UPI000E51860A|nr:MULTISPECIES: helix-turn-helix domain-containing protein [Vagococcus]RHH70107.1 helix-turn-helix domain-containing protein [Vagococcus sp. AM17-17]
MARKKKKPGLVRITYHDWLTEDSLVKLEGWARDGLTDKQIATEKIGVTERALASWKKNHPSIRSALKRGKEVVDREVENALLKSAKGFYVEESKTIIEIMPDGERKQRIEKTKKYIAPNSTSQIFWLKNRKPEEWRDRRETELSGNLNLANTALEIDEYLNGSDTT